MWRTIALSITALTMSVSAASADYTYDQLDAVVRRAFDPDGNGVITRSEFQAYFRAWQVAWSMSDFDTNSDSVLTGEEVQGLIDHVGSGAAECDQNMDYAFTGTEVQCVEETALP